MGKDYTVTISGAVLFHKSFEPSRLFHSKGACCRVKDYVQVLSAWKYSFKPINGRTNQLLVIFPSVEVGVMVA
jgi:hypothetical protein